MILRCKMIFPSSVIKTWHFLKKLLEGTNTLTIMTKQKLTHLFLY